MGFINIHGIDASSGMLKESEKKRVYTELDELFLGSPDTYPAKYHSKYDFTTASGILADNHLDNSVFEEMLLSLKQGGIAVFTSRTEYLESYGYGAYMQMLEETGKWQFVKKEVYIKYDKLAEETEGKQVGRFQPCEVTCFAYKKL